MPKNLKNILWVNLNQIEKIEYYTDGERHLVCLPYSKENLHKMAEDLNIKRCWFHKNHYDIPLRRKEEIENKCTLVSSKDIVRIIRGDYEIYNM